MHFAVVAFIVGGLLLVAAGGALGWAWVRNRRFRMLHLAAIGIVAAEALLGLPCPLTVWEAGLRADASPEGSFVGRWLAALLYWNLPEWVFTTLYTAFAAVVAIMFRIVPPRRPDPRKKTRGP